MIQQPTIDRMVNAAQAANFSLNEATFATAINELVDTFVFDQDKLDHIDQAFQKIGPKLGLTDTERNALVNLQKIAPFIDDQQSAETFLPIALYNLRNRRVDHGSLASGGEGALGTSVKKFLFQSARSERQINRVNIEMAADLFYSMVVGEELEVFNAAEMLLSKHLRSPRYAIRIESRQTIDAIRLYTYANRFEDIASGALFDRSQEQDRMLYYKQLFNFGQVAGLDEADVNVAFQPLWDTLMVEVAKYIEKVESSTRFEFVSKNNIFQAIEDLQTNLSDWCPPLIQASAGLIYSELEFVSTRLFGDRDIMAQVGRREPTELGVLKQLLADMNDMRRMSNQNIDALFKKAMLGYSIIMEIAKYTPTRMETGNHFGEFISTVQAFFVAQELLESQPADTMPTYPGAGYMGGNNYMPNVPTGTDDFNF